MARLGGSVRLGAPVIEVHADRVILEGGEVLVADLVVDGRGVTTASTRGLVLRAQKFLGQHVQLTAPHGLTGPLLMDAMVSQEQGYRFVYLLPFTATEVLIEDTYYSDSAELDTATLRQNIARYAAERGWQIRALLREERVCCPSSWTALWLISGRLAMACRGRAFARGCFTTPRAIRCLKQRRWPTSFPARPA